MKRTRKLLAVLLTLALVLSFTSVFAFAATKKSTKTYSKYDINKDGKVVYTVLGDSIAAGYSLPGFVEDTKWKASWPVVDGSYPQYVGKAIGADKIYQDAHIGLRSHDLRYLLCEDYPGDIAVGWRVPTTDNYRTVDQAGLAQVRKQYYNHIKKADVITLGIGINDLTIPGGILDNVQGENLNLALAFWGDMLGNAYKLADNAAYMAQVSTLLIGFYRQYVTNFNAIVKKIKEINPNAKLLVIGYYNAAQDAFIKGALPVDIGALVTPFIDLFNSHAAGAAAGNGYTYVKMEHIDTLFCDRNSPGYLNDNHPTAYGHKQMADIIVASLNAQI
ncbi:MAG: hypothetical protein IJ241_05245 [Clostridia bacterium]|nr:hypothetical protein [Clostridia bacterium]MBQ8925952.1 hypothetical protein [Clostridia bacterium]